MSGTTPTETRILAMWDDGISIERIARQLELRRETVADCVSLYHDSGDNARERNAMIAASANLLSALRGQPFIA